MRTFTYYKEKNSNEKGLWILSDIKRKFNAQNKLTWEEFKSQYEEIEI